MKEGLVVDTGPLVALARGGALEAIGSLPIDFVAPREVAEELERGEEGGRLSARPDWLTVLDLSAPLEPIGALALDVGEAAVIQLALERGIETVCIDETKGRRYARSLGLAVTGTLGLLLRAKSFGAIERLEPVVRRMQASGVWFRQGLVERVLEAAGEPEPG
jgi:predicted nucleic acid-binding protein